MNPKPHRSNSSPPWECCGVDHFNRRTLLKTAGLSGLAWLTPLAESLARDSASAPRGGPAKSVILLWLAGGPSQLETFDPHAGTKIAGGTTAISTSVPGIQLASGLPQLADQMSSLAVARNVVSREGDHERATYNVKTGFRPDPTLVHPSIGAVLCHQLPGGKTEIPRHVSILPGPWYGRGGYLGDKYDAFKTYDPLEKIPDIAAQVSDERFQPRLDDLEVVDHEFARGRLRQAEERRTLHRSTINKAIRMMSSEQLTAFDVGEEPRSVRDEFGDTPFGRGCLAAMRLIGVGVRCVEVTLSGWDSHVSNHAIHERLNQTLDPAFAALIRHLKARDLFNQTIVLCGGEFGRTPTINRAGGRDHWPHGFSVALAGGGLRRGHVIGQTDAKGEKLKYEDGIPIADIHATVLHALGIDCEKELDTPVNRPMRLSEGQVIGELLT